MNYFNVNPRTISIAMPFDSLEQIGPYMEELLIKGLFVRVFQARIHEENMYYLMGVKDIDRLPLEIAYSVQDGLLILADITNDIEVQDMIADFYTFGVHNECATTFTSLQEMFGYFRQFVSHLPLWVSFS